uniref:Putative secreted peptide n=1 Tax=Anopheles braziliensis TaxID=58242 RepID=A0A2M3ZRS7_9DIPT
MLRHASAGKRLMQTVFLLHLSLSHCGAVIVVFCRPAAVLHHSHTPRLTPPPPRHKTTARGTGFFLISALDFTFGPLEAAREEGTRLYGSTAVVPTIHARSPET